MGSGSGWGLRKLSRHRRHKEHARTDKVVSRRKWTGSANAEIKIKSGLYPYRASASSARPSGKLKRARRSASYCQLRRRHIYLAVCLRSCRVLACVSIVCLLGPACCLRCRCRCLLRCLAAAHQGRTPHARGW